MKYWVGVDMGVDGGDFSCKTYFLRIFGKTFVIYQRLSKPKGRRFK